MQGTMKRIGALVMALIMAIAFMPALGIENAHAEEKESDDTINVYLSVSNKGVLAEAKDGSAMAWKKVTVKDIDEDEQFTYDEALVAAHKEYNDEDGYVVDKSEVKKLWGEETSNTLFFNGTIGLGTGVTVDTVEEGDHLLASINADNVYYADWESSFDKYAKKVAPGKKAALTLMGHLGMAFEEDDMEDVPLANVQVGEWKDGAFVPIEGASTDASGKVKVSFADEGQHIITAKGTVNAAVTDWNLMDLGGETHPYGKVDFTTYDYFVAYTEDDYGEGPYPPDEIEYIDFFEPAEAGSESEYAWQDLNYLTSNQVIAECPIMAPACILDVVEGPADPIDVDVTVSDKGVLAKTKDGEPMLRQELTAEDIDQDGEVTVNEVLVAAHQKYFEGGVDGYATKESEYGPQVSKLWGEDSTNNLFFVNDEGLESGVGTETMKDGDWLYASVNQDNEYWSDVFCKFNISEIVVDAEDEVDLTLRTVQLPFPMAIVPTELADVQIGLWEDGEFKPLEGVKTDENGKATVSFDEPGVYVVTAKGTVKGTTTSGETKEIDCPIMAPACVVRIAADPVYFNFSINNKGEFAKDDDGDPVFDVDLYAEDLNADGKVTVDEALIAAHARYCPDGVDGYEVEEGSWGPQVTKLWGVDTTNTLFFLDGEGIPTGVTDTVIDEYQSLYASINADDKYFSDYYTEFNTTYKAIMLNEKYPLKLTGRMGMGMDPTMKPLEGIKITQYKDGEWKEIEGLVTDENGIAAISFPKEGEYLISAKGTVKDTVTDWTTGQTVEFNCPIMAPYCFIDAVENKEGEAAIPAREAINFLPDPADLKLTDKDAVANARAEYDKLTYDQQDYISNSQLTKLKLCEATIDKLQAEADRDKALADKEAAEKAKEQAEKDKKAADEAKAKAEADLEAANANLKNANDEIAVLKKQVKSVKAKGQKKKAKITWKSLGSGYTYEVYRATKLNGKFKKVKTTTSKKAVIKKLKSKKTYYVKVRAFKKVNGKKVYTNFSDTKSVKVK